MADEAKVLMAHLMRRAGFGAPYSEVEARAAKGYEATVEELLHPEAQPELDDDIMMRYKTEWVNKNGLEGQQEEWVFRMVNSKKPLEEKMALFWHGIFCTGHAKCEHPRQQSLEIDMFRRNGMGRYEDLLMGLAYDPAMVFYLDRSVRLEWDYRGLAQAGLWRTRSRWIWTSVGCSRQFRLVALSHKEQLVMKTARACGNLASRPASAQGPR
jgi:uncharacterized protein (DUF1800 family)